VRAIADSGYGVGPGNAMEMLILINTEGKAMGNRTLPLMRQNEGSRHQEHRPYGAGHFLILVQEVGAPARCSAPPAQPRAYNLDDAHFVIFALSVAVQNNSGLVFQAAKVEEGYAFELGLSKGQPQVQWVDAEGRTEVLASAASLPINRPAVLAFTSAPGAKRLPVNAAEVARSSATFALGVFAQTLRGGRFSQPLPASGF
jgi:endoglucanase